MATASIPPVTAEAMQVAGVVAMDKRHVIAVGRVHTEEDDGGGVVWTGDDGGKTSAHHLTGLPGFGFITAGPDSTAIAIAGSGLYVSVDVGQTWRHRADGAFGSVSFAGNRIGWATLNHQSPGGAGAGSLVSTNDRGRTWQKESNPCQLPADEPVGVSFSSASEGWVACAGQGGAGSAPKAIVHTRDRGRTWTVTAAVYPPHFSVGVITLSGYLTGIAMHSSGVGIAWMGRGITERTQDGGRHWAVSRPGRFDLVLVNEVTMRTQTEWWTSAWDGHAQTQVILRSRDQGVTWETVVSVPLDG